MRNDKYKTEEESFVNEIQPTSEEYPFILPNSDDIKPLKKKKKKKKNSLEEETFVNEILPTSEEYPIILSSSDDIRPSKKKKKKKKNSLEDPSKNLFENKDISTFGEEEEEESSMRNDKYKTEIEFVVHELKPDLMNLDLSNLNNKKKKKNNELEGYGDLELLEPELGDLEMRNKIKKKKRKKEGKDDLSSDLIQNLLQLEYKKLDKKPKKRKRSKDSQIDPLAEVGTTEPSSLEFSTESDNIINRGRRKKKRLDDYFLKPTSVDYFLPTSTMKKDFNLNS